MQWAAWLDLTILFFLPALAVVAYLARARTSRLGWVAAVLAVGTTVPGIAYVLAPDVLYVGAVHGGGNCAGHPGVQRRGRGRGRPRSCSWSVTSWA